MNKTKVLHSGLGNGKSKYLIKVWVMDFHLVVLVLV